ncbi:MAG: chitobiase/beta-hexosaminidase C-terminal domain-containing protein, partial [Candidatus Margulisiibacteriota bacterium]
TGTTTTGTGTTTTGTGTTTTGTGTTTTGTGTTTTGTGTTTTGTETTTTGTGTVTTTSSTSTTTGINQVATPTFTLSSGSYEANSLYITIECETADVQIYYTLNGDSPTTSSTPYSGTFSIEASKVVKALAIKSGMTNSYVGSSWYDLYWWQALGGGVDGIVTALFYESGGQSLFVGGEFETASGLNVNFIAKWDCALQTWEALGQGLGYDEPAAPPTVSSIFYNPSDSKLYVGGMFTAPHFVANNLAQWNGSTWEAVGGGTNNSVLALAYNSGTGLTFTGGEFSSAGGVSASCVAKWTGSTFEALGTGPSAQVRAMVFDPPGNNLFVTGASLDAFGSTSSILSIKAWNGSNWLLLDSGSNVGFGNTLSYSASDNTLYVGGTFTAVNGITVNRIAKYSGGDWQALGSGLDNQVRELVFDPTSGKLYVGGEFANAGGVSVNNIARWNTSMQTWEAMGSGMNDRVIALALDRANGTIYAGGAFTAAGGVSASRIAKWARKN